ncbi:MAG: 23S rRNA pseudouridine(2604) synthase RluF [Senegalia sp. (in: firmicutes)]|uniref:23S rRNA pseudouridine(2604) synthase RluF n=1 Tax=Senegalia sp. (in: firmicutes) TaxID=1924098 RepID=UPI003F99DBEF
MDTNNTKRINKFIRETGLCSRREADKLIVAGRVTINGKRAEIGSQVREDDDIKVDGKPLRSKEKPVYIALNKPRGITCTTESHIKGNIVKFMNYPKRIFPIGRLDKDSEGLIFLTNDGDIVNKILRAGNNHEKEYIVTVDKAITDEFIRKMASGIPILDTVTKKCFVEKINKYKFRIILTQGLNRQIRRMTSYLGYEVLELKRIRIMNVNLDNIALGKWRYLTSEEMDTINKLTANSSKTINSKRI